MSNHKFYCDNPDLQIYIGFLQSGTNACKKIQEQKAKFRMGYLKNNFGKTKKIIDL
jgi:hypothetical protein